MVLLVDRDKQKNTAFPGLVIKLYLDSSHIKSLSALKLFVQHRILTLRLETLKNNHQSQFLCVKEHKWDRKYFTLHSQHIGPVHDTVASFETTRKKQSFDGKLESDESQSTVHFIIDPITNNRGNDEDL